jgi:hypothetical protein
MRMIPSSDRQSDAFDNPAKMACREGNLRLLREAAYPTRSQAGRIQVIARAR